MSKKLKADSRRVIRVIGEISYDSLAAFCEELAELEKAAFGSPIVLELCSEGGDTYAGLGFYAKITNSHCPIRVEAYGCVMSAATVVLAAGDVRRMQKDCWLMVHDDSAVVKAANPKIAVSDALHHEHLETHWASILSRHSRMTVEAWRSLSNKTTYLTARQCKDMKLVHEIY